MNKSLDNRILPINLYGRTYQCTLYVRQYGVGKTPLVQLFTTDGEPFATVSVNIPDLNFMLEEGEFFTKGWSENEGLIEQLVEQKVLTPTFPRKTVDTGFVTSTAYKLLP